MDWQASICELVVCLGYQFKIPITKTKYQVTKFNLVRYKLASIFSGLDNSNYIQSATTVIYFLHKWG